MKIKPEHLKTMRVAINAVLQAKPSLVSDYETGNFPRADRVKDLQIRFNFDLYYMALDAKWVCDNIYPYANDTHIATALRTICPIVTRKY